MKSGGPWNLRGLRPDAREAARAAARRSGMSVGEWLNNVIEPDNDADAPNWAADVDDGTRDQAPRRSRHDNQGSRRDRGRRRERAREHENQNARIDEAIQQSQRIREEQSAKIDQAIRQSRRIREEAREEARREGRREAQRAREEVGQLHERLDKLSHQIQRLVRTRSEPPRPAAPQTPSPQPAPARSASDESIPRLGGAPVRLRPTPRPPQQPVTVRPRVPANGAGALSIDQAVAEITARQRVLDDEAVPQATARAPTDLPPMREIEADDAPVKEAPAREMAVKDAAAREAAAKEAAAREAAAREAAANEALAKEAAILAAARERTVDLGNLERQLQDITARIEALRSASDPDKVIGAIRDDLTEIARLITEALPRRALESLEIEVKALGARIDHSRQCGVDAGALTALERGLAEVRDALRGLTPAESLVGFDKAVEALAERVDLIVANDDPATLQQLETAIGALRGIVSHVASNEALTKVAEDVRALAAKVDSLANAAASGQALSALETRIETLTNALTASSEAGHAVPRELEKLLSGLIEKLEWVQLTHTDHAALAHLEDRIATLVQRFDASEARFGHLEAVERGIADLLVHIEKVRSANGDGALQPAVPFGAIERDVAEIKQSEARTKDSLEAVQGAMEHVVDRLAMIESGMRESTVRALPAQQTPPIAPEAPAEIAAATDAAVAEPVEGAQNRAAAAAAASKRTPIDPNLPPDHPLEPGSALGRTRREPSAADRIAASEAAVGPAKAPATAEPAAKPNFIAAARRAAQAAAASPSQRRADSEAFDKGAAAGKPRARKLIVIGAAAVILLGFLHVASRWFEDGNPPAAPAPASVPAAQPQQAGPPQQIAPQIASPTASPSSPPVPAAPAVTPPKADIAPRSEASPPADISPPRVPSSVPSAPPSTAPAVAPPASPANEKSGAAIDPKPVPQLSMRDGAPQPAMVIPPPIDITGSLLQRTPHGTAVDSAHLTSGDKLPAGIGGPALRAAAQSGDAAAAYEVAVRFAEGRGVPPSNEDAVLWLNRAAKQGLAPAQFRLGSLYEKGLGVKKDLAAARDLYLAAAEKGNGKAMHNLAVLYAEGINGPADYINASHWFRAAADHGVTDSQYNLGILYARGIGVAQNYAESYKWFALAANAGDKDAAKKSDEVAAHLDKQSLAAVQLAVKTWSAQPQPADAVTVKVPPGGWDAATNPAPAAKPKPRALSARPATLATKID